MTELIPLIDFLIEEYQFSLSFSVFQLIGTVLSIIFLFPIILSVLHYQKVKSNDYLIIVGFLLGWMINILITPLVSPFMAFVEPPLALLIELIQGFSFSMFIFFGTIHAMKIGGKIHQLDSSMETYSFVYSFF